MTRIAVVSDTHLPRRGRTLHPTLVAACEAADLILHAGDLVGLEVLLELAAYGDVRAVHGNCDEAAVVRQLPATRVVEVDGVRIGMLHDAGRREGRAARMRQRFPGCRVVVFGHSHAPLVEDDGRILLLNPGSANDRRAQPVCTMALLDVVDGDVAATLLELPSTT